MWDKLKLTLVSFGQLSNGWQRNRNVAVRATRSEMDIFGMQSEAIWSSMSSRTSAST